MNDSFGMGGELHGLVRRADGLYEQHLGNGQPPLVGDLAKWSDGSVNAASQAWRTALHFLHRDAEGTRIHAAALADGATHAEAAAAVPEENVKGRHHMGPGTITNVGVTAHQNDPFWLSAAAPFLKTCVYGAVGTGATASAATDYQIQTAASPTATTAISGTQSNASVAMTAAKLQVVHTFNFTSSLSITEWTLGNQAALSAATGSPATGTSSTTLTATGTPFVANAYAGCIVVAGSVYGLIASNTTSVLTLVTGWCNTSNGAAGSTPGSTSAFTIQPAVWDHKTFTSVGVNSGDSLTTTYTSTEASGG